MLRSLCQRLISEFFRYFESDEVIHLVLTFLQLWFGQETVITEFSTLVKFYTLYSYVLSSNIYSLKRRYELKNSRFQLQIQC